MLEGRELAAFAVRRGGRSLMAPVKKTSLPREAAKEMGGVWRWS
jgi:hypothetical protein